MKRAATAWVSTSFFRLAVFRLTVCGLAFSSAASLCLAQEVTVRPRLQTGDVFELLSIRDRSDSSRPEVAGKSRTPVKVTVLEANASGFVLDWVNGETDLSEFPAAQSDPIVSAALRSAKGLHLEAELSIAGEYKRLRNTGQASAALGKIMDEVMTLIPAQLPSDQAAQVQAAVRRILSPGVLLSSAAQDIQVYFTLSGASMKAGEDVEVEMRQTGLDGSAIPAYFKLHLDSANDETATFSSVTRFDPASLRAMTVRLLEQTGANIPPSERNRIPPVEMRDEALYVYDRASGLMRSVKVERSIVSGGSRRVDTSEIQLVSGPSH